jgi:predicted phage terminase large subunit-like protein
MQRLHQQDLVGEVMDREEWELLSLPAIAEHDENYLIESPFGTKPYVRKTGEALHPERDLLKTYQQIREIIGEYNFQSQYQQNPTAREGGLIKRAWLKYYVQLPKDIFYIFQSWDTANKIGETNSYSVCTTWGLCDQNFYLIDVHRERLTYPQLKRKAGELFRQYQPSKVLIEDKASGISLIQELKEEGIYCVEAYKPAPGSDKFSRMGVQSIKFERGRVYLPTEAPWLDDYIREITGFPGSKHDDQVDSTSQALEVLSSMSAIMVSPCPFLGPPRVYESC